MSLQSVVSSSSDDVPLSTKRISHVLAVLLVVSLVFGVHGSAAVAYAPEKETRSLDSEYIREEQNSDQKEILWLARALYSETKREYEQEYVAWVIRNRVTAERYPDTYKAVVLQQNQFSGLNPKDEQYGINISRTFAHTGRGWDSAVEIATAVYYASEEENILPQTVYHFYSPRAVKAEPKWAADKHPTKVITDPVTLAPRFAFYANVR